MDRRGFLGALPIAAVAVVLKPFKDPPPTTPPVNIASVWTTMTANTTAGSNTLTYYTISDSHEP